MNLCQVSLALLFLCFIITFTVGTDNPTHFTAYVSINCGSTGTSAARSGREWLGDVLSKSSSLLRINGSSTTTTVIHSLISADPVPHKTARISLSRFSYTFQVTPGQKILRLHFNSPPYKGFKRFTDLFTVEAGPFTLLSNFSASLTAAALGVHAFAKEFCLNIQENQQLTVTFSPETSQSLNMYAFINGIEIMSVPASLSYFQGSDIGLQVVGKKSLVHVHDSIALEVIYRLNIKQDFASSADDSDDIFGMWVTVLKQEVSNTNNITWKISVDVGFRYLVRLHFSKLGFKMAEIGGLNFKFLIDEMVAKTNTDIVVKERDRSSIPLYEDYIVMIDGRKQEGKRNLLICLQSDEEFMDVHRPLKGFEIFKLSNPDRSLASPNPLPPPQDSPSHTIQIWLSILGRRNVIVTLSITIISLLNGIVHKLRENWEANGSEEENKPSARAERLCRRFSLAEIQLATRNFSDGLLIGKGGFGKVYKGLIDKGQKTVAVKRLKLNSRQGSREFLTEIETLSELRHINLVSLIGYCNERREMILVYEYMARGTLADHLYKLAKDNSNCSPLTWKQRLNICIGAARGLDYLHTGQAIIHRDIKTSNILLDENFVAKVSDFGLAKPEDRRKLQSHVSTKVKGTFGYHDPHYFTTCKLTRNSDTYAFGVVLLEVLCGRPAVNSAVSEDERILTMWARDKIRKGEIHQIVSSSLREEISSNSLKTFVVVAERCLENEPKNRPTMSEVVLQLGIVLKQQDSKQNLVLHEIASVTDNMAPSISINVINRSITTQQTMATADMQNHTLPRNEQTSSKVANIELTSRRKHGRKSTTIKLSRLWPWEAFWKRVRPSRKNELSFSGLDKNSAVESLQYDFREISAATNDFSDGNKLGQGGFGPVYRGKFLNGQEIAVKRLSSSSGQGNIEFKNEVLLLARLQHRNLVRLLGFSLEGREMLLVYEFVENSSLDRVLFDPIKRSHLDWDRRYKIIKGTARGLLYLHEDSRIRIIHRDLKASNVLLDGDLNPKIADFGMARLLANETQGNTSRIVGTYGYMAPEYAMHGYFSVKSDVFSFGVLVLEILSGRRNSCIRNGENVEDLLTLTWKNWREGTSENMIDPVLMACKDSLLDMLRCIHICLLCVQENAASRPTMASVVLMLSTSNKTMPLPSEPAYFIASRSGPEFSISQEYNSTYSNSRKASKGKAAASESASRNEMSVTELYPRMHENKAVK